MYKPNLVLNQVTNPLGLQSGTFLSDCQKKTFVIQKSCYPHCHKNNSKCKQSLVLTVVSNCFKGLIVYRDQKPPYEEDQTKVKVIHINCVMEQYPSMFQNYRIFRPKTTKQFTKCSYTEVCQQRFLVTEDLGTWQLHL